MEILAGGTDRIILIEYSNEKQREKVETILKVTEEEIGRGYTWGSSSIVRIFLSFTSAFFIENLFVIKLTSTIFFAAFT